MAGSMLASYVPSALTIVINHPATNTTHVVGGLASDSVVSIEYPDATWTEKVLNYGETVRTHKLDKTLRVTLHVDQTSVTNDFLSGLMRYDESDLTGLGGIFTCTLADKSSRTYAYSSMCFVKRPQTQEYGSDTNVRDWVIVMAWADQYLGGSMPVDQDTVNALEAFGIQIDDNWKL